MTLSRRNFVRAGAVGGVGLALAGASLGLDDEPAAAVTSRCSHRLWPEHGLYEATIVYGVDENVPSGIPLLPMDTERDTLEYRTGAYDFFRERYGIDFDPTIVGDQQASDGGTGVVNVTAVKTGEGSTHQVHAIDAQKIPKWRGKFPLTNVAFRDDGYFVFVLSDFVAHGTYGGHAGLTVRAGDILVQGEYRMFDQLNRLMDVITYFADTPATVNPFNGDLAASDGATFVNITCRVESDLLGTGTTRGLGEQRPMPDGSIDLDFRYVMHFPSRLTDSSKKKPRCDTIRPL